MIKNPRIFLYGPQTSGKTTRLLNIIKRDHGRDILMSGEDRDRVSNGREVCDITLRVPKTSDYYLQSFKRRVKEQLPVKHILIDGAQFLSKHQLIFMAKAFDQVVSGIPLIFAGCRYLVTQGQRGGQEIPSSHFLINWCNRAVSVNRQCDFCNRIATRLVFKNFRHLTSKKIIAVDPHLVCDVHYRKLMHR